MKQTALLLTLLFSVSIGYSQQVKKQSYPTKEDVLTIDGIIKAYYEVISGPAGEPRNWERDNSLHHPDALIAVTGKNKSKASYIITQSLNEYHEDFGVPKSGFWEYETHRKVQSFGNITHVWSTYETKKEKNGDITARGINSIQLYNDGTRYWILSWMFDSERSDNPLPKEND